jgi:riboflavin synthase
LVGYRGTVVAREPGDGDGVTLRVQCEGVTSERPEVKDSIAIDGVCLTATAIDGDVIRFDVVPETLARSTLGERVAGDRVNVEYALRLGDRIGGHMVYGHVDCTTRVLARAREGQGERMQIEVPRALAGMIVPKGFVAIDGVSLTVASVNGESFEVALIPETLARTTLGERAAGSNVNLEADPLARYAAFAVSS